MTAARPLWLHLAWSGVGLAAHCWVVRQSAREVWPISSGRMQQLVRRQGRTVSPH